MNRQLQQTALERTFRTKGQKVQAMEEAIAVLDAATTTSEDVDPETEATEEEGDDGNSVVSASDIVSDIVPLTSDMLADIEDDEVDDDIQEENDIEGNEGWQRTLGDGSITDARCD